MKLSIDDLLDEALTNVRADRELTKKMAEDVTEWIANTPERHTQAGMTASKYLETLQRSNEQIIKIATLIRSMKRPADDDEKLEDSEKTAIYEEFEGDKSGK